MNGYRASARLVATGPRLASCDAEVRTDGDGAAHRPYPVIVEMSRTGAEVGASLISRWEAIRERWTQLTFYLFDPNSWR